MNRYDIGHFRSATLIQVQVHLYMYIKNCQTFLSAFNTIANLHVERLQL